MLFDLSSGKRKRVIQVIYALLALLMGGSLVLFGIGSDAPGGILDAVGLGGGGGSSNPQYEQEIEDAEERLEENPRDQQALLNLARYNALDAQDGIETDPETGQTSVDEDARKNLEEAVAAWEEYIALKPRRPDSATAAQVVTAYRLLLDAGGAASAQEIVAADQKTATAYSQLALFYYADGKYDEGAEAGKRAVAAAEGSDKKNIQKYIDRLSKLAEKERKRAEKAAKAGGGKAEDEEGPVDPFGAFGGGGVTPPAGG